MQILIRLWVFELPGLVTRFFFNLGLSIIVRQPRHTGVTSSPSYFGDGRKMSRIPLTFFCTTAYKERCQRYTCEFTNEENLGSQNLRQDGGKAYLTCRLEIIRENQILCQKKRRIETKNTKIIIPNNSE